MNRKGFTLIELLGVIIILGILAMITFPVVLNQIKNAKQGIKDSTKALIIDAAKDYYEENTNNYERIEGMTYCIDINTLTDNGYLNKKIKDENINDISNTKKVKMTYHNSKFNYYVADSCTKYTVTFDANGGTVDIASKEVTQDSVYGELPIPTRAGYTFLGWNGKNLFDMAGWMNAISGIHNGTAIFGDNRVTVTATDNDAYTNNWNGWSNIFNINAKPNTTYTLTCSASNVFGWLYVFVNNHSSSNDLNTYMFRFTPLGENETMTFTTPEDTVFMRLRVGTFKSGDTKEYSNIQIEEGTEATPYEPYYITPETKVVQEQNHTLKAIWKAN